MSLPRYIRSILEDICKRENIQEPEIICEYKASIHGGYMGVVTPAELRGTNKVLKVVVKTASNDEVLRAKIPLRQCCLAEIQFYDKVVREYEEFFKAKHLNRLTCVPKCYGVSSKNLEEVIVLENLIVSGYELWNKDNALGQKLIELALQEYANLSGIALAYKLSHPEKFAEFGPVLGESLRLWFLEAGMLNCIRNLCELGKKIIGSDDPKRLSVYTKFCDRIPSVVLDYDCKKDPFSVITQSDCWINNIMYKYNKTGGSNELEKAIIIDFQLAKCSSPIFDLSQFLAICANEAIWNDLDHYLRLYHNTLSSTMRELGTDPERVFPYDVFLSEFKKHAAYGFVMSAFFIRVMVIEDDEAPKVQEFIADTFWDKFNAKLKNESVYEEKFRFLINYYYVNDLF